MGPVVEKKPRKKVIPASLVYEEMDGQPIYRKGYQAVLAGKETLEGIVGRSVFQTIVTSAVVGLLMRYLPEHFVVGEAGVHLSPGNDLVNNLAVYNKKDVRDPLSTGYFDIPPKLVIELDSKVDAEHFTTEADYMHLKMAKLLAFGVPRVIWITTQSRKLMIAEPGKDWIVADWNREVALLEGLRLNLEELLKAEGLL